MIDADDDNERREQIWAKGQIFTTSAAIGSTNEEMERPALLEMGVSPPQQKIAAARWFLSQLTRCIHNEASALMFLEAFLSTLRSATFALKKMLNEHAEFEIWYARKQEEMRRDPHLRWVIDARNVAEKEGIILAEYGPHAVVRVHKDGSVENEIRNPTLKIAGLDSEDVYPRLEECLARLSALIEEAHETFKPVNIREKKRFSIEFTREREDGTWEHFDPPDLGFRILHIPSTSL
jgi:hypothetical protein